MQKGERFMPFWESSIFWGIAGIIGGFIVAAFFFYMGKAKKYLVYQISTSDLITDEINSTPGIKISVGDEPAVNVISSTITFSNNGNQTINSSDFASLSPLQIITSEHFFNAENIDVSYIKSRNKALNPKIDVREKNRIIIEFEYLKPKQEFEITVLHDGELSISGDLTSGTIQNYNSASKTSGYRFFSKIFLPICGAIIAGILSSALLSVLGMYHDSENSLDSYRERMYELQLEVANLYSKIDNIELENQYLQGVNQQLQDTINLLRPSETPSRSIEGQIPEPK